MLKNLREELFGGWSKKEGVYAWSLIAIQILFYVFYPDSLWGFIAGVSGTICVLLVAKGKISNYFFGFIQTGIMMVLGFQAGLIGETGENIFYFVTQFVGIYHWRNHMDKTDDVVKTRKMTVGQVLLLILLVTAATFVLGSSFDYFNGTQPFLDSFTLVAALFAQVLMVYRFREQWSLWIFLNVVSLYQWATIGNMSLFSLYIAMTINSLYGLHQWSKNTKKEPKRSTYRKPIV